MAKVSRMHIHLKLVFLSLGAIETTSPIVFSFCIYILCFRFVFSFYVFILKILVFLFCVFVLKIPVLLFCVFILKIPVFSFCIFVLKILVFLFCVFTFGFHFNNTRNKA